MANQIFYPNFLNELNKFRDGLFYSKYPTYKVYTSRASNLQFGTQKYKQLNFIMSYKLDQEFTINGQLYKNNTIINDRNVFLKSTDVTDDNP